MDSWSLPWPCRGRAPAASSHTRTSSRWLAAYAFHIAQNQPFVDGNKRTGLAAALVFLDLNGLEVRDPEGLLHGAMLDLAERRLDKEGLAVILRKLAAEH